MFPICTLYVQFKLTNENAKIYIMLGPQVAIFFSVCINISSYENYVHVRQKKARRHFFLYSLRYFYCYTWDR